MFSTYIAAYLFLGGAAGGVYCVVGLWSLGFHRNAKKHNPRLVMAFKPFLKVSYAVAFLLLVIAVLFLVFDLGYPERALLLFTRPHLSILTFGAYTLLLQMIVGFLLLCANLFDMAIIGGKARRALEVCSTLLSLIIMSYTGLFLATNGGVPFWNTWTLVVLFFLSSLSSGLSVVFLICYASHYQMTILRAVKPMQIAHVVILLVELIFIIVFVCIGFATTRAGNSIALLLSEQYLPIAIIGVLLLGVLMPLFIELYALLRKEYRIVPFSDIVCLVGCFCLRYCVVMCGALW